MVLSRDQRIIQLLQKLQPVKLQLVNNSAAHAGHSQHLGPSAQTGETHYQLSIVSPAFEGLSRVDRQRQIMNLLKDEFTSGLHALEIKALAPNEAQN
jgi:BolA protein